MFFEFALIGTTASGKTELAANLAREFKAVILSLDSLCVYKEINIANAKPSASERDGISYFGLDLCSVNEHFDVNLFINEYKKAREFAILQEQPLVIVGGSGFYLKAMMDGLSEKVNEIKTNLNNDEIYALLKSVDKNFRVERNDTFRLKKWLSIYENKNQIPSEFLASTRARGVLENIEIYELFWEKEKLKKNIRKRTKNMLSNGLIEEARFLFSNFDNDLKALNSIGLKECRAFLKDEISLNELEELICIHTVQLAKRQRTFNKKFVSKKLEFNEAFEILSKNFRI